VPPAERPGCLTVHLCDDDAWYAMVSGQAELARERGMLKVERAFVAGQVGALEFALVAQLRKRRTIFSNVGLVQCI
jgi:hypothetical protein